MKELKEQRAEDEPRCEELRKENAAITAHLMATKEIQTSLVKDIEALKVEKSGVLQRKVSFNVFDFAFTIAHGLFQETLNSETVMATETISRTRARIVQSPERIKRTIVSMGSTAMDDKKTVTLHEAKARDLQAKITALFNIEKVKWIVDPLHHVV